jgi:V-type H+-transporting ATPase subunit C
MRYIIILLIRFGLPVNFVAIVIHPTRKSTKRLRDVLDQLFGYLDQSDKSRFDEVK